MDAPKVERCRVVECCYNQEEMCHALAITVGGSGDHPACDTFCDYGIKGGDASMAEIGACKVSECEYNQNLECKAAAIVVGPAQDEADCLTFKRR